MSDLTMRDHARDATRPPVLVAPGDELRAVARRLWEEGVGAAVVGDGHDVQGVISERDIVTQLARGADPDTVTAEEAMTSVVVTARPDDPLLDVVFLMMDATIRHIPVVDDLDGVTGMVSLRDVVRPLLIRSFGG